MLLYFHFDFCYVNLSNLVINIKILLKNLKINKENVGHDYG